MYLIYVCILLERNNKILLSKRSNTGWMDGYWHIPGGGLEENESLSQAVTREAKEELAIDIDPTQVKLVHVLHLNKEKLGFYFAAQAWQGEPINNEPHECSEVAWFDIDKLPEPISPFADHVIATYRKDSNYSYFD